GSSAAPERGERVARRRGPGYLALARLPIARCAARLRRPRDARGRMNTHARRAVLALLAAACASRWTGREAVFPAAPTATVLPLRDAWMTGALQVEALVRGPAVARPAPLWLTVDSGFSLCVLPGETLRGAGIAPLSSVTSTGRDAFDREFDT